jgi:hypothetical protein
MNPDLPLIVAYGGGINSTAMLCGFRERGIRPDLMLFADTGAEHPRTYAHLIEISALCQIWWGIEIITVRELFQGKFEGLERDSLRKHILPSLAYGSKRCSMRFKVDPQNRYVLKWMDSVGVKVVTRAIGYHAAEGHRAVGKKMKPFTKGRSEQFWYPLIDWQWRQADCVEAIKRHGMTPPGKSSCFFCPAMKRHEIIKLRDENPDLYERAITMEKNLKIKGRVKGLSMGIPWTEIVAADDNQAKLFDWVDNNAAQPVPCGCYDG